MIASGIALRIFAGVIFTLAGALVLSLIASLVLSCIEDKDVRVKTLCLLAFCLVAGTIAWALPSSMFESTEALK